MWKRRQTRITQFSVKQDLVKYSLSYTLCSSYSRWPKGWMDNDICDISAILDGCARFLPAFRFLFSPVSLSRTSDRAGPICPMASLFLPRSLRPLVTRVTRNFRFSHTCRNISLSSLTFALYPFSFLRIHARERFAKSIRARKDGEGRKFRNNLHLQTGLIISPLKLAFPNFIIY